MNCPKTNTPDPLPEVSEDEHPQIDEKGPEKVSEVEHPKIDGSRLLELFGNIREVQELGRFEAGDTLIVHTEGRTSSAVSEDIQNAFKSLVPDDVKVVVCQGIRKLEVIKRGEGGDL